MSNHRMVFLSHHEAQILKPFVVAILTDPTAPVSQFVMLLIALSLRLIGEQCSPNVCDSSLIIAAELLSSLAYKRSASDGVNIEMTTLETIEHPLTRALAL
ncbi:hypothetical protein M514_02713 [Trichuris suis]|uniref:Uncharacterized protein n=1 Tax=Trichuris suis TaxID=68888 RepID=A0A085NH71_9BILA|nr:hypothetical protein M513_02713 [Trichuris suis]KFD68817.1 hypothetical protein M514_02713 [Trichuris suis]